VSPPLLLPPLFWHVPPLVPPDVAPLEQFVFPPLPPPLVWHVLELWWEWPECPWFA
jgi:hypothetical protein